MADKTNEVLLACNIGNLSWLKRGLCNGVDPHSTDREGFTGLHIAAKNGQLQCLKYLLYQVGVDVNLSSKNHKLTPLHCSLLMQNKNSFQCMKLLLDVKADFSIKDDYGQTVLHYAAKNGMINCVKLLFASGADIHQKDNDGKMPYEIACLYNQHECFRLLSSLHWAHDKDVDQLKGLREEELLKRRSSEKLEYHKCVTKERASSAYNDWLHAKCFDRYKKVPRECEKRKESRLTSSRISSACTSCSTATSRCQSTPLSSQRKTVIVYPIEVSTHQKLKNLDFIGKPKKMLPYTNYCRKSSQGKNAKCSKRTSQAATGRSSKFSSISVPSGSTTLGRKKLASTGLASDSAPQKISTKKIENNFIGTSSSDFELTCNHGASDSDHREAQPHTGIDDGANKGDIHKDDIDDVPFSQYNVDKDKRSIFHMVGPSNNLDSLSLLPSVLAKGRILAEVIEHIRNFERNKSRESNRESQGIGLYHSRQFNRRTSIRTIPEDKMVHDNERYHAYDDDRVEDRVFIDMENAVGSMQGEGEGKLDDLKLSEEQHKFYTDDELLQSSLTEDGRNICSPDLDSSSEYLVCADNIVGSPCGSMALMPTLAPTCSQYISPTIRGNILMSERTTPLSTKDALPSTIIAPLPLKDVATSQIMPSLIQDLGSNITPPARKNTPLLRKTTSSLSNIFPHSRTMTSPSRRIIHSSSITSPTRKVTPPPKHSEEISQFGSLAREDMLLMSETSLLLKEETLPKLVTPLPRENTPPSLINTPKIIPLGKMMLPSGNISPSLAQTTLLQQPDAPLSRNILHPLTFATGDEVILATLNDASAKTRTSAPTPRLHTSASAPCIKKVMITSSSGTRSSVQSSSLSFLSASFYSGESFSGNDASRPKSSLNTSPLSLQRSSVIVTVEPQPKDRERTEVLWSSAPNLTTYKQL